MRKIIIFLFMVSISNHVLSQDSINAIKYKKNSIKVITAYFPALFDIIGSVGFERFIGQKSSISLTVKGYEMIDGEGDKTSYSIIPSCNFYFASKNKTIKDLWITPSFIYTYFSEVYEYSNKTNNFGLGLTVGKRLFFSKKKRLFIDLGGGAAYLKTIYKYHEHFNIVWNPNTMQNETQYFYTLPKSYFSLKPRLILFLGYKF